MRLRELNALRFSVSELLGEFDLQLNGRVEPPAWVRNGRLPIDIQDRMYAYSFTEVALERMAMFKSPAYDPSGWRDVHCPWAGEHTGGVDNGAALREPSVENGWHGAFRCHHGSHINRGWRELTDWVAEESVEAMELGAESAARAFEEQLTRKERDE